MAPAIADDGGVVAHIQLHKGGLGSLPCSARVGVDVARHGLPSAAVCSSRRPALDFWLVLQANTAGLQLRDRAGELLMFVAARSLSGVHAFSDHLLVQARLLILPRA